MKRFGLALGGCEVAIETLIKDHLKTYKPEEVYTLIEIGSAGCVTLRAFKDIITDARSTNYAVVGFDLVETKAWSLDWPNINVAFDGNPRIFRNPSSGFHAQLDGMALWLLDDPRTFLKEKFNPEIDFAFIDGCHGKCAAHDFEAIESKVRKGGLVMFHDVGVLEQGRDWQTHCGEYINVRQHIRDLGLLDDTRPGWRLVGEIPGSRVWGGDGNSCAVFQKL